ncbi:50S ribosomal protein L17 [Geobacter sp. DSM 9736]|uniref:50S ribosomal protein L17 n=1 Tax=Geobacter sp. DSM 9736 TaxID=1277350 RepID=UPI000B501730|nr:50S ribosomal protein L17 [Geobacter sp. DSM 9736]SNB46446.1 LSU ribosomal protein L17P [Geobacter sp. DSM 9736]
MQHNKAGRRLGRTTSHRVAMFRNMVTSFLNHEKITTTDAKAKELRSIAEKMITLGKRGDLHAMRQAASYIRDKKVVTKLFTTIAPRYKERPGGYTRIIKLGIRPGDNAPLSIIELVEEQVEKKLAKKPVPKKASSAKTQKAETVAKAAVASAEPVANADLATAEAPEVVSKVVEAEEQCEAKAD